MPTLSDLLKLAVHVKIVPDAEPNADGEWIVLGVSENRISPRTDWKYLTSIAPRGYHAVAVRA